LERREVDSQDRVSRRRPEGILGGAWLLEHRGALVQRSLQLLTRMPIRPMLATLEEAPLEDESLVYEPKYDGIRAIVEITPDGRPPVRLWSRLGKEKTGPVPDPVAA